MKEKSKTTSNVDHWNRLWELRSSHWVLLAWKAVLHIVDDDKKLTLSQQKPSSKEIERWGTRSVEFSCVQIISETISAVFSVSVEDDFA